MLSRGLANHATRGAAWLALLLSLALTALAWRVAEDRRQQQVDADLQFRIGTIATRIEERVLAYEQLLRGAAGLFAASDAVDRSDWRNFVGTIGLDALPGVEGMGFARRLQPSEVGPLVDAMRREGFRDFDLFPAGERPVYTAVTLLEPLSGRNLRAFGYDMYSEPTRRLAMEEARDSGRPALTGRVVLVQEGERPRQAGFLLYMPVYRQGAALLSTEHRRAALVGWVYAPFRMNDFMRGLFGDGPHDLALRIRDSRTGGALMFGDATAVVPGEVRVPLRMANRIWELSAVPREPSPGSRPRGPEAVALAGVLASFLILAIVRTLAGTRSRALAIADRMTEELRDANERLEERVRERTGSLRDSNERLGRVNGRLQAMTGAFAAINAPASLPDKVRTIAAQARAIVQADVAVVVLSGTERPESEPLIGIDASGGTDSPEHGRWYDAVLAADRAGDALGTGRMPAGEPTQRLHAPLRDSAGRPRGYLVLGRRQPPFALEDGTVLSQLALLIAGSISLHETLAREQHARAEAERADRAKDEMLAVVSHELRTPLNAIQGWLHVLRRRRANDLALLDRAVEVIQRNLDTQVQLVDDLLDTARIVSGKLRLELQRLDLASLLRSATEVVRPLTDAKQIGLDVSIAGETFETVGDPSRLEQVVWNLLTNAVKFTPTGGMVTVRLTRLGWLAQLDVEDNGIGIEPAFLPHVFDRFQQADSSNTRSAGGLGLGLALVQHIVQAHGGQVMARSEGVGRGTCFTVTLPLGTTGAGDWSEALAEPRGGAHGSFAAVSDEDGAPPGRALVARPLRGMHVLVLEDHEDSRELLAEFLGTQGAEVHAAGSGNEALQRLRELPPGTRPVLLCDIALPGETGYDVLTRIRRREQEEARPPAERVVALALSAFTREEDRQRSLAAGFIDHLTKPISQVELMARLRVLQQPREDTLAGSD